MLPDELEYFTDNEARIQHVLTDELSYGHVQGLGIVMDGIPNFQAMKSPRRIRTKTANINTGRNRL